VAILVEGSVDGSELTIIALVRQNVHLLPSRISILKLQPTDSVTDLDVTVPGSMVSHKGIPGHGAWESSLNLTTAFPSVELDTQRGVVGRQCHGWRSVICCVLAPVVGVSAVVHEIWPSKLSVFLVSLEVVSGEAEWITILCAKRAVKFIQLFSWVTIVNISKIWPIKIVSRVFHTPQNTIRVKVEPDLVPQSVGENLSIVKVVATRGKRSHVGESSNPGSIRILIDICITPDAHVQSTLRVKSKISCVMAASIDPSNHCLRVGTDE